MHGSPDIGQQNRERASAAPRSDELPSWRSTTARRSAPRTPRERAEHRLAEFLRAYGLTDLTHLARVIDTLLADRTLATDDDVAKAVEEASQRLSAWLAARIGEERARTADPERVRALLAKRPDILLDDGVDGGWLARELAVSRTRPPPRLKPQPLRVSTPRWLLGLLPAFALAVGSVALLAPELARGGWNVAEVALAALLAVLSGLHGVPLTLTALGLARRARKPAAPAAANDEESASRTAVVVAIYNEDAERVFSGIAAMRESLAAAGARGFEIFVLSDTQNALIAAAEERAVRRLRSGQPGSPIPLHYRRRTNNAGYKSGNLAEFFVRWGGAYDYVVVLDADSLVEGETLVELARRMDADPNLGLLQLPIEPVNASTPFARLLQLSGQLHGPLFTAGLAAWSGPAGNYYGHNAIVRVPAFVESCGLPELSGQPPFGGLILSHDFVEAALLRRAGWKVEIAADLGGSYEELPPTIEDFVARDRRWAQGNLQHLRVAVSEGLAPMSRLHLLLGALAYLAAPLWLAFVVLACLPVSSLSGERALLLAACAAVVLLVPKVAGLADAVLRSERRRGFGGAVRLVASWVFEIAASALLAPILMLHHVVILARILGGSAVGWKPQRRRAPARGAWAAVRRNAWMPLVGVGAAAASATLLSREHALWLAAVWAPWIAAPALAWIGGSARIGALLARLGLFRVPTETEPPSILERLEDVRALCLDDGISRFRDVVLDPVLNALHRRSLDGTADVEPRLLERALRVGPAGLSAQERAELLASESAMRRLHRDAWTRWPVEACLIDRSCDLAPPDCPAVPAEP